MWIHQSKLALIQILDVQKWIIKVVKIQKTNAHINSHFKVDAIRINQWIAQNWIKYNVNIKEIDANGQIALNVRIFQMDLIVIQKMNNNVQIQVTIVLHHINA